MQEYALSVPLGDITNLIFSLLGVFMAHNLYKSTRKRWQCVTAWILIHILWAVLSIVFQIIFPEAVYERVAIFAGLTGVFVYLYLFPNIPIAQRVFTYFFVDTCMYFLVLFPRSTSLFLAPKFHLHPDILFIPLYCASLVLFIFFFCKYLRNYILKALSCFQKNLNQLTLFATISYTVLLLLIDPWGNFVALSLLQITVILGIMSIVILGYTLSFRTLISTLENLEAEHLAKTALMQAQLVQREYQSTTDSIAQIRKMRHDIEHHFFVITGYLAEEKTKEALAYIASANALMPKRSLGGKNIVTGSFAEQYRTMCEQSHISFSDAITYDENLIRDKTALSIILGNGLKNAYESAHTASGGLRFVRISGKKIHDNIVIVIENGFEHKIHPSFKSSKAKDRGLGISNIRDAAEKCGGYLECRYENGVFILEVVLIANS